MSRDGLLHYVDRGSGSPIVVLHGFTGAVAAMGPVIDVLTGRHRVVALDLAGHGKSPPPDAAYSMDEAVADVARVVAELGLAPVHLFGYSMGGRVALSYAVARPREVASVATLGASSGISSAARRADRAAADSALADRIEQKGIAWFAKYWSDPPMLRPVSRRGTAEAERMRAVRLGNDPAALAGALRALGPGVMPPLHDRLAALDVPALFLAGAEDAKYRVVAVDLAAAMPDARFRLLDGAGHVAHLDDPEGVAGAVLGFLADVDARSRT